MAAVGLMSGVKGKPPERPWMTCSHETRQGCVESACDLGQAAPCRFMFVKIHTPQNQFHVYILVKSGK